MRRLFTWDRSDYVFTRGATIATAAIVCVVSVGLPLWDWLRGNPLVGVVDTGSVDTPLPESLAAAEPGATLTWDGVVQLQIADPSAGLRLAALLPSLLVAALAVAIAVTLHRLIGAAEAGRPFAPATTRSLRTVGWLIFAGALLLPMIGGFADSLLILDAIDEQVSASYSLSLGWVALGLLVLLLAEIFRIGSRLADDVDGLV